MNEGTLTSVSTIQTDTGGDRYIHWKMRRVGALWSLPTKVSRGNQLIHRRLTRTKSRGSSQDPESVRPADSQTAMVDSVWSW